MRKVKRLQRFVEQNIQKAIRLLPESLRWTPHIKISQPLSHFCEWLGNPELAEWVNKVTVPFEGTYDNVSIHS